MKNNGFITTLFIAVSLLTASCSKDNDKPVTPPPVQQEINSLTGTFWEHTEISDYFDENNVPHRYNVLTTVDFQTDTSGLIEYSSWAEENPSEPYYENCPFSYTYNAPKDIMSAIYHDKPSTMDLIIHGDEMRVYYDDYTWMVVFTRKKS